MGTIKTPKTAATSNKDNVATRTEILKIEQAKGFKKLEDAGQKRKEIAERAGVTVAHVSNMIKVAGVGKKVHDAMAEGLITPTTVLLTMHDHGDDKAEEIILEAIKQTKAAGKKKTTKKGIEKVAGGHRTGEKRISATYRKVTKTIDLLKKEMEEAESDEMKTTKQESISKLDKVAQIVDILDTEKDADTIATKILNLL